MPDPANDGEVPEGAITDLSSSWTLESNLVESGVENEVQNFGNFASSETAVEVGDRVRIRFLTGDKKTLEITFTDGENDPENGNININEPLGRAVIGLIDSGHAAHAGALEHARRLLTEMRAA